MRDKKLLTYRSISHAIFSIVSLIENLTSVLVIFNFIQNKTCYYNIITKPLTDLETSYAAFDIPANWLSKSVGMIEFSTGIIALYLMRFNNSELILIFYIVALFVKIMETTHDQIFTPCVFYCLWNDRDWSNVHHVSWISERVFSFEKTLGSSWSVYVRFVNELLTYSLPPSL